MFLVVGANSEIGSAAARLMQARGEKVLTTTRRLVTSSHQVQHDFNSPIESFAIPEGVRCACIFVAVARLAACEADPAGSALINVKRTIALIDLLVARRIYTLFLSTNQVFDGDTPHVAAGTPMSPISEYGRQKAETESLLHKRMADGAPIGVLRLAKVVSPGMALLSTWTQELVSGRKIRAFSDMTMAPTPVDLVAISIARMMEERLSVVAQLTGPRDVTYVDIARFLANKNGVNPRLIEPVSALESGMAKGATPRNTTLDCSLIAERYGVIVPDAFDVIDKV
jgi:dTDP-4-dehydrorhamnose reductase